MEVFISQHRHVIERFAQRFRASNPVPDYLLPCIGTFNLFAIRHGVWEAQVALCRKIQEEPSYTAAAAASPAPLNEWPLLPPPYVTRAGNCFGFILALPAVRCKTLNLPP